MEEGKYIETEEGTPQGSVFASLRAIVSLQRTA